ncbi:hypothetical protein LTS17_012863 [Exophiala oligosperma]
MFLNPYRHLINHILLKKIRPDVEGFLDAENEDIDPALVQNDSIVDIQANRSTKTTLLNYSLLATQPGSGIRQKYIRTIQFTQRYHALFGLDRLDPAFEKLETTLVKDEGGLDDLELGRLLDDKNAEFRDDFQHEAVLAIFDRLTYLTYINKTGSGKSVLYLLPAFARYQDSVNIVVTPRISLRDDLLKRAQDRNILVARFEDLTAEISQRHTYSPYNLVVASIESILNSSFTEYVLQVRNAQRPVRIYLDEVHTIVLEQNFRWVMKYVNSLLQYRVPLVFISATLPVSLLHLVEKEFLLPQGVNQIIQAQTIREEIKYKIVNIDHYITPDDINHILERFRQKGLHSRGKAVIFVPTYKLGTTLSNKLSLPFYNAKDPEKDSILRSFLSDDGVLALLATSALALGVDFSVVRFTLHVPPHLGGLVDFIQGSSRIRRDGISIILQKKPSEMLKTKVRELYAQLNLSQISTVDQFKSADRLVLQKLLNEDRCVRQVVSHFLDNVDIGNCIVYNSRASKKVRLCYLCRREQDILDRQADKEGQAARETNVELAQFEDLVDIFGRSECLFCLLLGNVDEYFTHPLDACAGWRDSVALTISGSRKVITPSLQDRMQGLTSRLSQGRGLVRGSCCFTCLLPSWVCERLKDFEGLAENVCLYPRIIKAFIVIYEYILQQGVYPFALKELGLGNIDIQGLRESTLQFWDLSRRPTTLFGTESIEACRYFNALRAINIVQHREKNEEMGTKRYRLST